MANQESTLTLAEEASRRDVQHDLQDARGLIEEADNHTDGKKYRKAAEIILLKILHADPGNEEARGLLQGARNLQEERGAQQRVQLEPEPFASPVESALPAEHLHHEHAQPVGDIPFTAVPLMMKAPPKAGRSKIPFILIAAAVLLGGVLLKMRWRANDATARPPAPAAQAQSPSPSNFQPRLVESRNQVSTTPEKSAAPLPPPVAIPAPLTRVETVPVKVKTPAENGRLAISSPTAADIFIDGQLVGSTPTTLQLPIGRHTIEYRHGDLRSVISSEIRPNETTSVSVTFPVTLQINARPWAQVFLDDGSRRPLGQTPLSGVAVPIGAVLAFENPNFPTKTHRVTEKDTAIQVNFP
jgi:hypothetical protein